MNSNIQINEIMERVKLLSVKDQQKLISKISKELEFRRKKTKNKKVLLDELYGIGKGIWKEDAQEYINRIREDRI